MTGRRWGYGKSYNLNGDVEFEGEWMDDHPIDKKIKTSLSYSNNEMPLCMSINNLVIMYESFNDKLITSLYFPPLLPQLEEIDIGSNCFQNVREFVLNGLENLESLEIGSYCFRDIHDDNKGGDGYCGIGNCPNLRQLEIGNNSCSMYDEFKLLNVNSLQSIQFGTQCFQYAYCIFKCKWEMRKGIVDDKKKSNDYHV